MDHDRPTRVPKPRQKTVRELEEEIARQNRRDLQQWYQLHKNDLNCFNNGGSSEFKF
jgi:hypothetical protein